MKYYLFLRKEEDLANYKSKLLEVLSRIEDGKTPVFNEMSCAKTNLIESVPYNLILGCFTIVGAILTEKIKINEIIKIAMLLVINHLFGAVSNYIFTALKHKLRLNLLKRLGLPLTDRTIAAMESLEYQSV